ncbi:tandem-95 repeat protein [Bradyrhizobium tropiciagri]|uniref:ELWxxDGT repeat protein n=1 Tax=Bradyrhizobium tropiciagri TaxID=312253 RepID=UPI001BAA27B5|nr:ELWxxDGT repeat protein [Bradyrhizobium tropiciagri]MBR0869030.1 tandem-95 repeat protein [Bradyrhizobium tropiciagri]
MSVEIFVANDGTNGTELWVTNGTAASTVLLKDIMPGAGSSGISNLFYSGSYVYFTADDGLGSGSLIWRTDGTAAGTMKLSSSVNGGNGGNFTPVGGNIFFTGSDSVHGSGLFTINGETGAIAFVSTISGYSQFKAVGSKLFFVASDGTNGSELWSSDGTDAGTAVVKDIYPGGNDSSIGNLTVAGNKVYFSATTPSGGNELWVSDGTAAGTVQVKDINSGANGSNPSSFFALGSSVIFQADDGIHGRQYWISDGTAAGTALYASNFTVFQQFVLNGTLYFGGSDNQSGVGHGYGLYAATPGGVTYVSPNAPYAFAYNSYLIGAPGSQKVIFSSNNDNASYSFDGTSFVKIADFRVGDGAVSGSQFFFVINDGTHGNELGVTDGTLNSAHRVSDINPGSYDSSPQNISPVGGGVVFTAVDANGDRELYFSDGTGAVPAKNVNPTADLSPSLDYAASGGDHATAGGKIYFSASDNVHGREVWESDGTAAGTHEVNDLIAGASGSNPNGFVAVGGYVYFFADEGDGAGQQLHVIDPSTDAETRISAHFSFYQKFVLNGTLYYGADDNAGHGYSLWQASPSGLSYVGTTVPYAFGYNTYLLGSPGSQTALFNSHNDNATYSFDGTSFVKVADFRVGDGTVSGSQFFFVMNDGTHGNELGVTDGTQNSAHRVSDVNPGVYDSNPDSLTAVAGGVVFLATNDNGDRELYFSNGTTTTPAANINATQNPSASLDYAAGGADHATANGKTYFSASDNVHGREVWESDGTLAGTREVNDLVTGGSGSNPTGFVAAGGYVYFFTDEGDGAGAQLHVIDPSTDAETRISAHFSFYQKFVLNGTLYYGADDNAGHGYSLWKASPSGLAYVGTTVPYAFGYSAALIGSPGSQTAIFNSHNDNTTWSFDGTNFIKVADFRVGDVTVSGSQFFYVINDGTHGNELGVGDATLNSAHMVGDLNPGGYNSDPQSITPVAGGVVFTADSGNGDRELYFSNGSTVTLAKNINATQNPGASLDYAAGGLDHATVGGKTYFSASDGVHGRELWETDGTLQNTRQVTDQNVGANGSNPVGLITAGGKLYFLADDGDGTGQQLHVVDPATDTETRISTGFSFYQKFVLNGMLYYGASDNQGGVGHGYGLWQASPSGLTYVSPNAPYAFGFDSYQVGSSIIFSSHNDNASYSFDGTTFTKIADFRVGSGTVSGSKFFFVMNDGTHGNELGVTDGTANSAHQISDLNSGDNGSDPSNMLAVNGGVLFVANDGTHGRELFFSNGTSSTPVSDIFEGSTDANIQNLTTVGSKVFFSASDFSSSSGTGHGQELWVYDSAGGTASLVKDVISGTGSFNPSNFYSLGGKFYFTGDDGVHGNQLWTSDGTSGGTVPVTTATLGGSPGTFFQIDDDHLAFRSHDSTNGDTLYILQGSTGTLTNVPSPVPNYLTFNYGVINGHFSFMASDGTNGNELYVFDGTNTVRVTDVGTPNSSNIANLTYWNGKAYFTANDGTGTIGTELYVSDGTSAGTNLLKDIHPGSADGGINSLMMVGGHLYFGADDGNGPLLWTTDGTTAGTHAVTTPTLGGSTGTYFQVDADHLAFRSHDSTNGDALYILDGTTGTLTNVPSPVPNYLTFNYGVINGHFSFMANDGTNGNELYVFDGTNTVRVTDVGTPNSSNIANLTYWNGKAYFTANDGTGTIGTELYVTDGTPGGTQLVKDIHPGSADGGISNLMVVGGHLYFSADDGNGPLLWTTDGTTAGTHAVTTPTLGGSTGTYFQVDADHLAFRSHDSTNGDTLYILDGTTGTLTNVPSPVPNYLTFNYGVIDGHFSFMANDGTNGNELYVFDGTNTVRVTDTATPNSSNASNFTFLANVAPTLTGATAGQATGDKSAIAPFSGVTIADADTPAQTQTVTITLDDAGKGAFTAASLTSTGFVAGGVAGTYTFSGTAVDATTAIHALSFQPTENRKPVGGTETVYFTVSVDDGAGGAVTNTTTSVVVTSVNDAPAPVADSKAVNEDATASAASRAAGVLGNDSDVDVVTTGAFVTGNLIVNGDAEAGASAHDFNTVVAPQGWTTTSNLSSVDYGLSGGLTAQAGSGSHFFAGGPGNALSTASQTIDVSGYAAAIDGGTVSANLGGLFGGFQTQDDHTDLKAVFLDAGNNVIGTSGAIGDVLSGARGNVTELLSASGSFAVPVGTRAIMVVLTATQSTPAYNDGYADNLSLTLSAPGDHETATLVVSGAHFGAAADAAVPANGSALAVTGTYGVLNIHKDGTYSYTPNTAAAEALPLGTPATDTFSYTVADPNGATTASTLTFNITGQNDTPVVSAPQTDGAHENDAATGFDLLRTASDVDTGETATLSVANVTYAVDGGGASATAPTGFSLSGHTLNVDPTSTVFDHLALNATETVVVSYDVTDVQGATVHQTDTVVITGVNDAPVGQNDTGSALEKGGVNNTSGGSQATGNVLANDTDVDSGDTRTVSAATSGANPITIGTPSATAHGNITLSANGTYTYAVNETDSAVQALRTGADTITDVVNYTVMDNHGATGTATLTITIQGANDAPVAAAVTGSTNENTGNPTTVTASWTDVDSGDTQTFSVDTTGTLGTVVNNNDGTFSYDPNGKFESLKAGVTATDTFHYTVTDAGGLASTQTATVTIHGENDAPVAAAITGAANEDTGNPVSLTASWTDIDAGDTHTFGVDTTGTLGTVISLGNGTFSYDPNGKFESLKAGATATDVFHYAVTDGSGATSTQTATVTITGQNDAPVAAAITGSANEDTGNPVTLTASWTDVDTGDTRSFSVDSTGTLGTVVNNGDGTFSYDPNGKFETLKAGATATDVFHYTVTDGSGATSTQTGTVTITGQNDAPVAAAIAGSANENTGNPVTLTASWTDIDTGDAHTFSVDSTGTLGTVVNNNNGTFSYNPNGQFEHLKAGATATDVFHYTVTDGSGATSTQTATVTITGENDTPTAVADTTGGGENQTLDIDVLANDTDVDDNHSFTLVSVGAPTGKGSVSIVGNHLVFNPGTDFDHLAAGANEIVTLSYTMKDEFNAQSSSTMSVTVTGTNDAPAVTHNLGAGFGGGLATITQARLEVTDVDNSASQLSYTVTSAPVHGQLKLNGADIGANDTFTQADINGGRVTYTHTDATTSDDGFGFSVSDGTDSATGSFVLTANQPPSVPVDSNGTSGGSIAEGAPQNSLVGITASSTDPEDGSNITWSLTNSAGGLFQIDANSGVVSVSAAGATGIDFEASGSAYTITVQAADTQGGTSTKDFTIAVTDVAPTVPVDSDGVTGGSVSEAAGNGDAVGITAVATDPNGGAITWSLTNDAGGRFNIDSSGVVHVADAALLNFETSASHTITVKAADAGGAANSQTFTIGVTDVAPVTTADNYSAAEDNTLTIAAAAGVLSNESDVHGGPITAVLDAGPSHASSFGLNADGSFHYTPSADFNGADSFSYHAFDGTTAGNTVTVNLSVGAVNDAPVANPDTLPTIAMNAGVQSFSFASLTGNDSAGPVTAADEAGQTLTITAVSHSTGGTVQITGGHVEFTPTANVYGTASFDYTISDNGTTDGTADPKIATGHASFSVTPANPPTALNDFNGDLHSDLVWHNDNGAASLWDSGEIRGAHIIASSGVVPAGWNIVGKGDFDGNGRADLLWHNDDGRVSIWDNGQIGGAHYLAGAGVVPNSWHIAGTGDFDGDLKSDILWYNDNGSVSIWDNGQIAGAHIIASAGVVPGSWHIAGTGDFNGDGNSDILWHNDNGAVSIWDNGQIAGAHIVASAGVVPSSWHIAGTGDFDGNGSSDIVWQNDNHAVSIWNNGQISGAHIVASAGVVPDGWHIAGTGDFNGDGKFDVAWHNDDGRASIWDSGNIASAHIIAGQAAIPDGWHIV